jgi:hypothetical protein
MTAAREGQLVKEGKLSFRRPRPRPPKAPRATDTLSLAERSALAVRAAYCGSPHHTDIPKYGNSAAPRAGAQRVEVAEADGLKNPSCTLCPRKWVRQHTKATQLLQDAIKNGQFAAGEPDELPRLVWARDPDDPRLVYEARLAYPPAGYKAYPLTHFQAKFNLPIELP